MPVPGLRGVAVAAPDRLGATYRGGGRCSFLVWAPFADAVDVVIEGRDPTRMEPQPRGYHAALLEDVEPGTRYRYRLDGDRDRPDPASRSQPDGVHGPSEVVDPGDFRWTAAGWQGLPLSSFVIYELHVGTFTREGTFDGVAGALEDLASLGVT